MADIRKRRESGLMPDGQSLPALTQGAYAPGQFGGVPDESIWTQPVWGPGAPLPPQLASLTPPIADFANNPQLELAMLQQAAPQLLPQAQLPLQALPQLPPQAQAQLPPLAMRGMMQNGLFTGAPRGLPRTAQQNPNMQMLQLMQLLSRSGLLGGDQQ